MRNLIRFALLGMAAVQLSSCMVYEDQYITSYPATYTYDSTYLYPQTNYSNQTNYYNYQSQPGRNVAVPDSYHVNEYSSPVSFKDRDKRWVSEQNPQGYTIEIANDQKASHVAQTLYKTPKNNRTAQIKYQQNGASYYKGVYGSYSSKEEAQKALDSLPAEIKQGAGITNWNSIQSGADE